MSLKELKHMVCWFPEKQILDVLIFDILSLGVLRKHSQSKWPPCRNVESLPTYGWASPYG